MCSLKRRVAQHGRVQERLQKGFYASVGGSATGPVESCPTRRLQESIPWGNLHIWSLVERSQAFFHCTQWTTRDTFEKHSASRFSKFKSILSDLAPELDGVRTDLSLCLKTINQPFMICMFAHVHVCAYVCTYV